MNKFHELRCLIIWMEKHVSTGMAKQDMHDALSKSDALVTDILAEYAFKDNRQRLKLFKNGSELLNELNNTPETATIGSLGLITDAALRNLDQRIHDDFGLSLSDEKATSRITACIRFRHFGEPTYFDISPGERAARKKAFQEHIKELGIKVSLRESRYKKGEMSPALSYSQNKAFFDEYFNKIGARITYTLDDDYIDEIALSLPMDKMEIYQPATDEPAEKPFSPTLTEPEAYTVKKNLQDLLNLIQINCSTSDMSFRPIIEPDIILGLLRSYLYGIEQVICHDLPIYQSMEKELMQIRKENRQARDMQTHKGNQALKAAQGSIRSLYTALYERFETFVNQLGLSLLDVYFNQYGALSIQMTKSCFNRNKPYVLDMVTLDNSHESQIADSKRNWDTIVKHFMRLDPNAFIKEAILTQNRTVRNYTVTMTDFQACARLDEITK